MKLTNTPDKQRKFSCNSRRCPATVISRSLQREARPIAYFGTILEGGER